jgi:peroxiredoxin
VLALLSPAPDFSLADTNQNTVTLSSFRGNANVLLVLNRGFTCPFCRQLMAQLRRDFDGFLARRTAVIVITPERPDAVQTYWQREQMPMLGLADPDHAAANRYRQEVNMFGSGRLPAMFLIDRSGKIRQAHYATSPADIPSMQAILAAVDSLPAGPD